ncbi:LysR family transcriptional regulator [Candidimonas humi]|uniref:LysR family transcriptional regulator n=1 Tax=Candidimonas humi TaxID=683355 RepID=A0ABV8NZP6_9BURK|nr:LysR family transcriptional regulator [Candidimonas humi]MBV6306784.1 LysR family transcriptional regulator [Candidimonas humi]
MKIEAFITLEAVLRSGTMAAASKEMNMTPSAVSMQIKQIEAYLGQPLFDRSGLQARPLPAAHEVAGAMRQALQSLEALRHQRHIQVEGTIRLGVIDSMQPILLPGILRELRDHYPALHVHPSRGKSATLVDAVKAGELDAAVVGQPESGGSARLRWHTLLVRELALIVPPLERETSVKALLKRYEWIRYDRKTVVGRMSARYFKTQGGARHSQVELDEVRAVVAMVSAGLGISMVQLAEPSICLTYPVRVLHPVPPPPTLRFALVVRAGDADKRTLNVLRQTMDAVLRDRQVPQD